ncbi:tyrosine-type recombinase/integrase [Bizionia saleffrena]|uniref:Tyrosine-type recombinase/integrase n=1 Tax=Bizionia saleffrena TaxID=291189 RepID=A0A8H2LGV4_9FLAO|nr:site-specific integrase [Bizionia saleffrena]TYB77952.1 tyrosine-type recombinase/integrase [Bizionia saleffrena]
MHNIFDYLSQELQNEYESEYDLSLKKNFSTPKIYSGNGDLNKRWYVYFSYRDPDSGKLKRQTAIYANANKFKTKEDRLSVLVTYRKSLLKLLKKGYSPYSDNTLVFQGIIDKDKKSMPIKKLENVAEFNIHKAVVDEEPVMGYKEAFAFGLKQKEKLINDTTRRSFENRLKNFTKWVEEIHPKVKGIDEVNKKLVSEFLSDVLARTSPRNRNNFRADLSSIVQVLFDNDIIHANFIKQIPVLKAIPKRNKTYTQERQEEIFTYLEKEDTNLLLFIKFISYNFLRPIEVCRLKVGDIDLKNKTIKFQAKNSPLKTKIIPDLLIQELPDLSKMNKELSLFTPDEIGGEWDTALENKRDYYSKRFKRVVKDYFGLDKDYGLYSFRHTYITKLYRYLVKQSSPFEAKSKLMLITGHSSMSALEKYLRDIDAELPEDYSHML